MATEAAFVIGTVWWPCLYDLISHNVWRENVSSLYTIGDSRSSASILIEAIKCSMKP